MEMCLLFLLCHYQKSVYDIFNTEIVQISFKVVITNISLELDWLLNKRY